jgi:hypothetical protein
MSINGGTTVGLTGVASSGCRNCGHPSHCGGPLREETYSSWGKRLGVIDICRNCTCTNCEKKT